MKGHLRKRGKNSWSIAIFIGKDEQGRKRYKWYTVRGGKRRAEQECTRLLNQFTTTGFAEPSKLSVAEYLERWLEDYACTNVSGKTFERYAEIVRSHLIPHLGMTPLAKLQPLQIQSYYSAALKAGRKNGKGGLSAQTVLHHHRVLRDSLQQALRWGLLLRNPADAADPPRPAHKEMRVLDEAQTAALLKSSEETSLHIPILLAAATGMRRGEILALRWSDIDLDAGTCAVCQSLEQTRSGGLQFKGPKTRRGRRVIALPQLVVEGLRKHRAKQARLRLQLGSSYDDHDLVCARWDGSPRSPGALTRAFAKFIATSKLPRIRLHDLRHSHATQLLRQGVHPKIVSERLGHSTISITLDTYSHVIPGMQEDAARRIDTVLRAALSKKE